MAANAAHFGIRWPSFSEAARWEIPVDHSPGQWNCAGYGGLAGRLGPMKHMCVLSAAALLIDCRHGVWSRVGRSRSGCIERAVRLPTSRRQSSRYTGDTRELAMSRRT